MHDDIFAEEEERFTEALAQQTAPGAKGAGVAQVDDDPAAQIAWALGGVHLTQMPPHVGRENRFPQTFMDLLVLFMNQAKRRGDDARMRELNGIYRAALGREA